MYCIIMMYLIAYVCVNVFLSFLVIPFLSCCCFAISHIWTFDIVWSCLRIFGHVHIIMCTASPGGCAHMWAAMYYIFEWIVVTGGFNSSCRRRLYMAAIFRYCFAYMFVRLLRLSIVKRLKRYIIIINIHHILLF